MPRGVTNVCGVNGIVSYLLGNPELQIAVKLLLQRLLNSGHGYDCGGDGQSWSWMVAVDGGTAATVRASRMDRVGGLCCVLLQCMRVVCQTDRKSVV